MPGFDQAPTHRSAHVAQPDEPDFHDASSEFLIAS
jgi:hypothetical protein